MYKHVKIATQLALCCRTCCPGMGMGVSTAQLTLKHFTLFVLFLSAQTAALFFVKYGIHTQSSYFLLPFLTKYFILGILCMAVQAVSWQKLLSGVDLSLAYAACSIFVIINLAVSRLFFAEQVTLQHFAGGALLCIGVTIIVFSKKNPHPAKR